MDCIDCLKYHMSVLSQFIFTCKSDRAGLEQLANAAARAEWCNHIVIGGVTKHIEEIRDALKFKQFQLIEKVDHRNLAIAESDDFDDNLLTTMFLNGLQSHVSDLTVHLILINLASDSRCGQDLVQNDFPR